MKIKTALQLGTLFTIALAIVVALVFAFATHMGDGSALKGYTVSILSVTVGILSLAMAYALYVIGFGISARIARIEQGIREANSGNLDQLAPLPGQDELAEISCALAEMAHAIRDYVHLIPDHYPMSRYPSSGSVKSNIRTTVLHKKIEYLGYISFQMRIFFPISFDELLVKYCKVRATCSLYIPSGSNTFF